MQTFRLATLNIHQFNRPGDFNSNFDDLIKLLRPLHLDLLAVQETLSNSQWGNFCQRLSLPHHIYGRCSDYHYGNGIASRFPIVEHSNEQRSFDTFGEVRSMLNCTLDGDQHPFLRDRRFAVTHLDHRDENARLDQLRRFDPLAKNVDVLMGDFNALTRDDYTNEYFQKQIVEVRKASHWEAAHFDVTDLVRRTWGYQDALTMLHPRMKDEQLSTCRFHTRIDYIYLRPRANDQWRLRECFIHDTGGATDHQAVVATFELSV